MSSAGHEAQTMEAMDPDMMFDIDFSQINDPPYSEPLVFDGLPDDGLFQNNINFEPSPPERLYPTPLSWDTPTHQLPGFEQIQSVPRSNGSVLTLEQQEKLRSIAMPEHLRYQRAPALHDSTYNPTVARTKRRTGKQSSTRSSTSISSPDHNASSRKRKCSTEADDDEEEDETAAQPHKKTAHNMIEKRYRTNLNDKFNMLRDSVPSLRAMSRRDGRGSNGDEEDLHGLMRAHKKNKATVLEKATEYIKHLEKMYKQSQQDSNDKDARIQAFEKLYYSGAMGIEPTPVMTTYDFSTSNLISTAVQLEHSVSPPRGLIDVPDDIRRMNAQTMQQNQQMYETQDRYISVPQHTSAANGNRWVRNYFPKMMVGSLATILVLDGFGAEEQDGQQPAARGLASIPVRFVRSCLDSVLRKGSGLDIMGLQISSHHAILNFKLLLLIGAFLYVLVPAFLREDVKSRKPRTMIMPVAAPSLASSIQVRRQAWLTSIQTVWVPRHNFFLEVTALLVKMCKLSLRNLVGSPMYTFMTGVTEEQEEGRIKAWNIALDAQLGGGDVEISKSRLTLTLLAFGTLPDTPARLMMKALHIKVLLWEVANATGCGSFFMFHEISAKLARMQWNKARQLEAMMANLRTTNATSEPFPPHLRSLLQVECDDVLNDIIGQRTHNLAWNKPTMFDTLRLDETMDDVITDFAIRSPLDAVSAWFSTITLQNALSDSLLDTASLDAVDAQLELAINTAPEGSSAHARALVARAVLIDEHRGASLAAAMVDVQAGTDLGGATESSLLINCRLTPTIIPHLKFSLACATAIAHISRSSNASEISSSMISRVRLPPLSQLSFLGFVASFHLMQKIYQNQTLRVNHSSTLESLAGQLRIWSGGVQGRRRGFSGDVLDDVTRTCLQVIKESVDGWRDEGYGSAESLVAEDDVGC